MTSYCFTKHATTEPEFPRVLKSNAPNCNFQLHYIKSACFGG